MAYRRLVRALTLCLAATVLASGCSGEPDPPPPSAAEERARAAAVVDLASLTYRQQRHVVDHGTYAGTFDELAPASWPLLPVAGDRMEIVAVDGAREYCLRVTNDLAVRFQRSTEAPTDAEQDTCPIPGSERTADTLEASALTGPLADVVTALQEVAIAEEGRRDGYVPFDALPDLRRLDGVTLTQGWVAPRVGYCVAAAEAGVVRVFDRSRGGLQPASAGACAPGPTR